MGYMRHHAIIVTGNDAQELTASDAHDMAFGLYEDLLREVSAGAHDSPIPITPLIPSIVNGYQSFVILADGSKEGWADSDRMDRFRDEFIDWLESTRYGDGGMPISYAEIQYGDDENDNKLLRCSSHNYEGKLTEGTTDDIPPYAPAADDEGTDYVCNSLCPFLQWSDESTEFSCSLGVAEMDSTGKVASEAMDAETGCYSMVPSNKCPGSPHKSVEIGWYVK